MAAFLFETFLLKGTSIPKNSIPYQSPKSMKNDVILDGSLSKPYMQSKLMSYEPTHHLKNIISFDIIYGFDRLQSRITSFFIDFGDW